MPGRRRKQRPQHAHAHRDCASSQRGTIHSGQVASHASSALGQRSTLLLLAAPARRLHPIGRGSAFLCLPVHAPTSYGQRLALHPPTLNVQEVSSRRPRTIAVLQRRGGGHHDSPRPHPFAARLLVRHKRFPPPRPHPDRYSGRYQEPDCKYIDRGRSSSRLRKGSS